MIVLTLVSFVLPVLVSAHGFVNQVTIDGTVYPGNSVGDTPTIQSVIRQINTNSPVKGASNPDINCGQGAQLAAKVANAYPGSTVQILWVGGTTGNTDKWPHNTGPIMHYMAECDGSCASYNSSNAEWFKVEEQGQKPNDSGWYMADIQSGSPATVTIPQNIKPGNYLLRSELITLQLAMSPGGAEFYPACIQLSIGGSGTGQATSSEEATFPGAYKDNDPGILTPNVYNPGFTYPFPGPPIAAFVSGGNSTGSSTTGSTGSAGASSASAAPSSAAETSSAAPSPSSPGNVGGNPPSSISASTPSPTSTGGSGSTCARKRSIRRSNENPGESKRIHRRRYRTSH